MRLDQPFIQLPLELDAAQLQAEVHQIEPSAWLPHPQGHAGNTAVPLLAVDGDELNNGTSGPMRPTPHLQKLPYVQQILAALEAPIGRTRLMCIAPQAQATPHIDTHYYWAERTRVHIPVQTSPQVQFICRDARVHMAPGEAWIFDTWSLHNVLNPTSRDRIHLVADTVGSGAFWQAAYAPGARRRIAYLAGETPALCLEESNHPDVMTPWEMRCLLEILRDDVGPMPEGGAFLREMRGFIDDWQALWSNGVQRGALDPFVQLRGRWEQALEAWKGKLSLPNGGSAPYAVQSWIVYNCLRQAESITPARLPPRPPTRVAADPTGHVAALSPAPEPAAPPPEPAVPAASPQARSTHSAILHRPVFIVAAPRSGSSLLFETLARAPAAFTLGGESHQLFESLPELSPAARNFESNAIDADVATPDIVARISEKFLREIRNRIGDRPGAAPVRLLEKTPKNALRIPFLAAAYPDARFIFLHRQPQPNVGSIIDAWKSGRFVTYPQLPGWTGMPWSLLLIPGWRELVGESLAAIAMAQWRVTNECILEQLLAMPAERWCAVQYEEFLANPNGEARRLAEFAELGWDQQLEHPLPLSGHTLTPPRQDKWLQHREAIEPLLPQVEQLQARLAKLPRGTALPGPAFEPATPAPSPAAPMRSVHTTSMPVLLRELGVSVFVSTYQAGKVVILRRQGDGLNTHFCGFNRPMGIAIGKDGLAIGTQRDVHRFVNMPAVSRKLPEPGLHDACFLPRSVHTTGDIQVHDLAWGNDGLWCVNTSFSCLCTLSTDASFVPRWRPKCITALTPEDRCHLNGLAMRDGVPRYVTALGLSDEAAGWRSRKRDGGVIIDVTSQEVIADGLCMPHSPRWHGNHLWVLNSGMGGLGTVDVQTGKYNEVARLPGFTRGLSFHGRFAFVGLSQVRETATFNQIPIAGLPVADRRCGVWVVDVTKGQIVAFTQFEDAVQEIFAVELGLGMTYPDIITDDRFVSHSYMLPDAALQAVPQQFL